MKFNKFLFLGFLAVLFLAAVLRKKRKDPTFFFVSPMMLRCIALERMEIPGLTRQPLIVWPKMERFLPMPTTTIRSVLLQGRAL